MKLKNLIAVFILAFSLGVHATEYFVAPNGSDTNDGSIQTPFKTIAYAAAKIQPGDIVTIRAGLYRDGLTIKKSGKPGAPITFRGMPGETAILSAGYAFAKPWIKTAGRRFVWETECPYALNMCFEKRRSSRYLELTSLDLLDMQPGAFCQDRKTGKTYVHALQGSDPNQIEMVAVPFFVDDDRGSVSCVREPYPYTKDVSKSYRWTKGFMVFGSYINIENLHFHFFGGQAVRINAPASHCIVKNNTVYCGTCGLVFYGAVKDSRIEGNHVKYVAGSGILLNGSDGNNCQIVGNYLYNNGECQPFTDSKTGGGGHSYNIAHYGGYYNVDIIDNLVIGDDPARQSIGHLMRCKGGICKHTTQTGNVFYGYGIDFYAASQSTATIANNTITNGKYRVGKLNSNEVYSPDFIDNLFLTSHKNDPRFADPTHYDFHLLPDSPFLGKGAFPKPGNILFVKAGANGDGSTPEKPLPDLATALSKQKGDDMVVYLMEGEHSGNAKLKGNATLRNYAGKNVSLANCKLEGKGKLNLDGITLKQSTIKLDGTLTAKTALFIETELKAKNAVIQNSTLKEGDISVDKLTLREALLAGKTDIKAKDIISEHNVFLDQDELKDHQKHCSEALPSFYADVQLDPQLRLPENSPLAYQGWLGNAIGGRPAPKEKTPLVIENLKATPLSNDRILVSWSTPGDYCDVNIRPRIKSFSGSTPATDIRLGHYMSTYGQYCFNNLKPGQEYCFPIIFRTVDGRTVKKEIFAKTPVADTHQPRTITVNTAGKADYARLGDALTAARRGDTILVAPGTYTEQLSIVVDGITLKSTIPGKAMLDMANVFDNGLLVSNVKDITIDGFRFIGMAYSASSKALALDQCRNVTVRNCFFSNLDTNRCANIALFAYQIDGLLIENCVFNSGFHGIWSYPTKNAIVRNNTFWGIGINAIHLGCNQGDKVEIYNNIMVDVVSNHGSPAVTVADHGKHVYCDYNLYWKKLCPHQCYYAFGRHSPTHEYSAPWSVKAKDMTKTFQETKERYGVEEHGIEADPQLVDTNNRDFGVKPGSPALKRGKDGKDIGADFSIFR